MSKLLLIAALIVPAASYAKPKNTGITGGMHVPNNRVPDTRDTPRAKPGNTGITGGMDVPNNRVPKTRDPNKNTGITGGMDVPNNRVPKRAIRTPR